MAFKEGVSGNPAGRALGSKNKSTANVKELIDRHGDMGTVIMVLFQNAAAGDSRAARILMEYYFGKPTQSIDFGQNSFVLTVNSNATKTREIISGE